MAINYQLIFFTLGVLLMTLGLSLVFPFLLDWHDGHANADAFGLSAAVGFFLGGALCMTHAGFKPVLSVRGAFLLTTVSWLSVCIFSALPLYISDLDISFTDAFFESVSGVTTTGATVLSGLDTLSRGVLLWRSLMQWIGGIGIIAFAMILLPFLRIGGMQLFRSESSDRSEKIMPRTADVVGSIILIYTVLTLMCFVAYDLFGMGSFDALIHAMTTVPTAGFSSHDSSFGYFQEPMLYVTATIFMFLGGVPFILYVKFVYQGRFDFWRDAQLRSYIGITAAAIIILTFYLMSRGTYAPAEALKQAAFNIVSIITTTGYASTDYSLWGPFAFALFFFLTYIGACAGSTAGGLKILRINIAFQALSRSIKTLIYPNGVFAATYQGKPLTPDIINTVMGFLFLYVFFNVLLTVALAMTGLDFITSITGAATAMANVGPGLGQIIGPAGNFSTLNDPAKWLLCFGMLLGRLEVMTILVLITPAFWRD